MMSNGFAPQIPQNPKKSVADTPRVQSIPEIQEQLLSYVEGIKDPRSQRTQKHKFKDIIVIALLAVIAGAEGWEDIENYGQSKLQWLQEFLELPNGIPSDDTFRRVFERIKPEELEQVLQQWMQNFLKPLVGEVVPIDGKRVRGSYDRDQGIKALNLVSAFAGEQKLVLGQIKVEDKSNEITAIPALLNLLDIQGAVITIDAMGTQAEIVQHITHHKADYILSLKKNHPTLYHQIEEQFNTLKSLKSTEMVSFEQRIEKGHHRLEKRRIWAIPVSLFSSLHQQEQWLGLQTIVVIERIRHLWNKVTREVQFYLSSLPPDAHLLGKFVRQHWGIENQLHWVLDVTFHEDICRIRSGHSPHNFALLRRLTLNLLRQDSTVQRSLRQKRKRAAMDNDYMTTLLQSFCQA